MAKDLAVDAVREYLERAGTETVDGLWLGLRRRYTTAEVRAALRILEAFPLVVGGWERVKRTDPRWLAYLAANPRDKDFEPDYFPRTTFYRLPVSAS